MIKHNYWDLSGNDPKNSLSSHTQNTQHRTHKTETHTHTRDVTLYGLCVAFLARNTIHQHEKEMRFAVELRGLCSGTLTLTVRVQMRLPILTFPQLSPHSWRLDAARVLPGRGRRLVVRSHILRKRTDLNLKNVRSDHRHRQNPKISRTASVSANSLAMAHNEQLRWLRRSCAITTCDALASDPYFGGGHCFTVSRTILNPAYFDRGSYIHAQWLLLVNPLQKGRQMQLQIVLLRLVSSCDDTCAQKLWLLLWGCWASSLNNFHVFSHSFVSFSLVPRFSNLVSQLCDVYPYTSCHWPFIWHPPATKRISLWDLDLIFRSFAM